MCCCCAELDLLALWVPSLGLGAARLCHQLPHLLPDHQCSRQFSGRAGWSLSTGHALGAYLMVPAVLNPCLSPGGHLFWVGPCVVLWILCLGVFHAKGAASSWLHWEARRGGESREHFYYQRKKSNSQKQNRIVVARYFHYFNEKRLVKSTNFVIK